jgi:hypothetical protein
VAVTVDVEVAVGVREGVLVIVGETVAVNVSDGCGEFDGVYVAPPHCGGIFTTRVDRNDSLTMTRRA